MIASTQHQRFTKLALILMLAMAWLMIWLPNRQAMADNSQNSAASKAAMLQAFEAYIVYKSGDFPQAFTRYLALAKTGNIQGILNVAHMYDAGLGVKKNPSKATHWYHQGALLNDPLAMTHYQTRLQNGLGTTADTEAAAHWQERIEQRQQLDKNGVVLNEGETLFDKTSARGKQLHAMLAVQDAALNSKRTDVLLNLLHDDAQILVRYPRSQTWHSLDKRRLAALFAAGWQRQGSYEAIREARPWVRVDANSVRVSSLIHEEWLSTQINQRLVPRYQITIDEKARYDFSGTYPRIIELQLMLSESEIR